MSRSTTCTVCGAPRSLKRYRVSRCEVHLQEWLSDRAAAANAVTRQRAAKPTAAIEPSVQLETRCKICGEPRFFHTSQRRALCRTHLYEYINRKRQEWRHRNGVQPISAFRQSQEAAREERQAVERRQRTLHDLLQGLYALRRSVCIRDEGCTWDSLKQRDSARVNYRRRYQRNETFRRAERIRILAAKHADPSRQAAIEPGTRWEKIAAVADGTVTREWVTDVLANSGACYYCGRPFDWSSRWRKATIDHDIPISRGGAHTVNNLRIACWSCNNAKGTRTGAEYAARQRHTAA